MLILNKPMGRGQGDKKKERFLSNTFDRKIPRISLSLLPLLSQGFYCAMALKPQAA
jgi:hypothetical protein